MSWFSGQAGPRREKSAGPREAAPPGPPRRPGGPEVGEALARVKRPRPGARLPARATEGATGYDLYACLDRPLDVGPEPLPVPTGIAIDAPPGLDVQVRPRSGLSAPGGIVAF